MKYKVITAFTLLAVILLSSVLVYAYYKKSYTYTGYYVLNGGDINSAFSFDGETGDLSEYISESGNQYFVALDIHNSIAVNYIGKLNAFVRYVGNMDAAVRVKITYYWLDIKTEETYFPRMRNNYIFNYNSGYFTKVSESGNNENTAEIYYMRNPLNTETPYKIEGVAYTDDNQNYTNIIDGINILDVYPEEYRLVLKFEFEALQYNRADELWAINTL